MSERRVFTVATVVLLVHALDDALVHRQPGSASASTRSRRSSRWSPAAAAIAAFPPCGPASGPRRVGCSARSASSTARMHVQHIRADGVAASDLTGVLAVAAGARAARPRRRDPVPPPRRAPAPPVARAGGRAARRRCSRRRGRRPVALAVVDAHKWREPIGAPPSAAYEPVAFAAADGLRAEGLVPPVAQRRRGARRPRRQQRPDRLRGPRAVPRPRRLRRAPLRRPRPRRERGRAERLRLGLGARRRRARCAPRRARRTSTTARIAALGLSTGADILLDVAPERDDLAAIVADGAAATSWEDWRRLEPEPALESAAGWVMFEALELFTGDPRPRRSSTRSRAATRRCC